MEKLPERDNFCFVCGKKNPKGLKLEFKKENGKVYTTFFLDKYYQGYSNIIHGGVISMILDEAMAHLQTEEERFLTGKITVKFIKPLKVEEKVTVTAWIEKNRKRLKETRAVMKKENGETVAEAEAIMFVKRENTE
ncbi:PaaI family thioesterase [Desulfurobacterium atlanticum]|uniref:Acyl-coenzyme A thioesterase PaaI, contains HGG motif n=1 Tax=Desulfurobacterium atlanticum TaxID=240169 RepID=A0A238ZSJ3_9BACT|nr:PaaI family thioesterase [Desulfurobacterium atlanticum]SNR86285.1 Acyl-coenzyme A thioesterase PaaI, contains HGG motif [Desulfurobacterium atlanticum]